MNCIARLSLVLWLTLVTGCSSDSNPINNEAQRVLARYGQLQPFEQCKGVRPNIKQVYFVDQASQQSGQQAQAIGGVVKDHDHVYALGTYSHCY